jgi:transposase
VKPAKYLVLAATRLGYGVERERETGEFEALPNQPPGNGHKITNWEKFREFVEVNGDKTQVEMASLWQGKINARTISRALKKIGFSRKKNLWLSRAR